MSAHSPYRTPGMGTPKPGFPVWPYRTRRYGAVWAVWEGDFPHKTAIPGPYRHTRRTVPVYAPYPHPQPLRVAVRYGYTAAQYAGGTQ